MPNFKKREFSFTDRNESASDSDFLSFTTQIKITSKGEFYTDLPDEIANKFVDAGVLEIKYAGDVSYKRFKANKYEDLVDEINKCGKDYLSKELISETLKIEFSIETVCHYTKDEDGRVFPTGYYLKSEFRDNNWRSGTKNQTGVMNLVEYGLQIYAKPFKESVYKYRSGKRFVKKNYSISESDGIGENGKWLRDIIRQKPPTDGKVQEIEYTEEIAGFFRTFFESLFMINERVHESISPEKIRLMAYSGIKLLGNGSI